MKHTATSIFFTNFWYLNFEMIHRQLLLQSVIQQTKTLTTKMCMEYVFVHIQYVFSRKRKKWNEWREIWRLIMPPTQNHFRYWWIASLLFRGKRRPSLKVVCEHRNGKISWTVGKDGEEDVPRDPDPHTETRKEPRNRFPAWRAVSTTLSCVPARQAAGGTDSSESIPGLLKRLQIRTLVILQYSPVQSPWNLHRWPFDLAPVFSQTDRSSLSSLYGGRGALRGITVLAPPH
jgi:hypothetical protein